jgi:hypothetical protein
LIALQPPSPEPLILPFNTVPKAPVPNGYVHIGFTVLLLIS